MSPNPQPERLPAPDTSNLALLWNSGPLGKKIALQIADASAACFRQPPRCKVCQRHNPCPIHSTEQQNVRA